MFSILACSFFALFLHSPTADANPRVIEDVENLFPKEKPIIRQLPQQNYWYTPRLGKRTREEHGFEYDFGTPVGMGGVTRIVKKSDSPNFIPRTGKRYDQLLWGMFPLPSQGASDGQNWEMLMDENPQKIGQQGQI